MGLIVENRREIVGSSKEREKEAFGIREWERIKELKKEKVEGLDRGGW